MMPRMPAILLACLLSLTLAAVSQPSLAQQGAPRRLDVSINNGQLDVNNVRPTIPGPRRELELALGAPDRVTPEDTFFKDGPVLKWDRIGLYGFQAFRKTTMDGVGIVLWEAEGGKKTTNEVFPGKLTIDGAAVTAQSTIEQINAAKRGAPFVKIDPTLYELKLDKVEVRIRTTKPGAAPEGVNISRITLTTIDDDEDF